MSTQHRRSLNLEGVEREDLEVDVLLVGAGPASLACAIHLKRTLAERGKEDASILVLEKAEDIGYHTLSGGVMDPKRGMVGAVRGRTGRTEGLSGTEGEVTFDCVDFLQARTAASSLACERNVRPAAVASNHGNHIVSLHHVVRWLKDQAEERSAIDVYPGFAGSSEVLYEGERVVGVQTRDSGVGEGRRAEGARSSRA